MTRPEDIPEDVWEIAHYITCERPNHNQDALND